MLSVVRTKSARNKVIFELIKTEGNHTYLVTVSYTLRDSHRVFMYSRVDKTV